MLWLLAALLFVGPSPEKLLAQEKLKQGHALMTSEKFEAAAEAFREAIGLDPKLMMAHYGLGQANMALKRYPLAVDAFKGAKEAFNESVADSVSSLMESAKTRDDRIRVLRDRIRENQDAPASGNTALARQRDMRSQEWEVEIAMLQRTGDPNSAPPMPAGLSLALGSAYFRSGQMADAEREYRAALAVQPRLGEPRSNLAVVLLMTGRATEAKEQLKLAEKNGFKVNAALKQDIDTAIAKSPTPPKS